MTATPKTGLGLLWILPLVLVPVAFVAAIPWLKTISHPMALLITAAVAIFGMSYASYLSFRVTSRLDEVQKAGAGFAAQWGAPIGQAAFALLLLLPAFKDFATGVVGTFAADRGMTVDGTVVLVSMALGCVGVVLLQAVGTVFVHMIWWTAKR